jgi:hypothetical protein
MRYSPASGGSARAVRYAICLLWHRAGIGQNLRQAQPVVSLAHGSIIRSITTST